jgi:hypothetical protein
VLETNTGDFQIESIQTYFQSNVHGAIFLKRPASITKGYLE